LKKGVENTQEEATEARNRAYSVNPEFTTRTILGNFNCLALGRIGWFLDVRRLILLRYFR
jgi:hypothetical protein